MKTKKSPEYFLPNPDHDVLNWPMRLVISKMFGLVSVHGKGIGGLSYIGRWVRDSDLEEIPEGLSMEDILKLVADKNKIAQTNKSNDEWRHREGDKA